MKIIGKLGKNCNDISQDTKMLLTGKSKGSHDFKGGQFHEVLRLNRRGHGRAKMKYEWILFYSNPSKCVVLHWSYVSRKFRMIIDFETWFTEYLATIGIDSVCLAAFALTLYKEFRRDTIRKNKFVKIISNKNITGYAPVDDILSCSNGYLLWRSQAIQILNMFIDCPKEALYAVKMFSLGNPEIFNKYEYIQINGLPLLELLRQCKIDLWAGLEGADLVGARHLYEITNSN